MKIYNEIVIDMNPESSSYGKTLHEDSYEYSGDMMFMQTVGDRMTIDKGRQPYYMYNGKEYASRNQLPSSAQPGQQFAGQVETKFRYPIYEFNEAGGWSVVTGEVSDMKLSMHRADVTAQGGPVEGMEEDFSFTYDEDTGDFDPTSSEFQEYVETSGGFGALEAGFGMEEGDFGEFYDKPLGFWEEEYGEEGTFTLGRGLERETVTENLRAATSSYDVGRRRTGMLAGQSLFDIKQQTDIATAKGGFAGSGIIAAAGKRAGKGVFQDYKLQQKELASTMAGAKTTADIARRGIDIADTQADIDWKRKQADFWKTTEEDVYGTLSYLEGLEDSDRRLKNNITKIGKSSSGINIYTFNYKNSDRYGDSLYQGVMSDEVPSNAVIVGRDGYDLVDYSKLDVEFKRVLI